MYGGVKGEGRGIADLREGGVVHGDRILLSWRSPRLTYSRLLRKPTTHFRKDEIRRARRTHLISIEMVAGDGGGGVRNEGGETGRGRNTVSFHSLSNRSRNSRVDG